MAHHRPPRKPEVSVRSLYSTVAEELGLKTEQVELVYSDYITTLLEKLPEGYKCQMVGLGTLNCDLRLLRKAVIHYGFRFMDYFIYTEGEFFTRAHKGLSTVNNLAYWLIKNLEKMDIIIQRLPEQKRKYSVGFIEQALLIVKTMEVQLIDFPADEKLYPDAVYLRDNHEKIFAHYAEKYPGVHKKVWAPFPENQEDFEMRHKEYKKEKSDKQLEKKNQYLR